LEVVSNFTYLCTSLTNNNEELEETQSQMQAANRAYFSILPLIKSRGISWRVRAALDKTFIRCILMYGSEVWALSQEAANKIDSFE
jgi:hypothetical protein